MKNIVVKAPVLLIVLTVWVVLTVKAQHYDTLIIHFEIGKYDINTEYAIVIKKYFSENYSEGNTRILIYGYADYLGTQSPNKILSEQRAIAVKNLILSSGVNLKDIKICNGIGQVNTKSEEEHGNRQFRKAEIYFMKIKSNTENSSPKQIEEPEKTITEKQISDTRLIEEITQARINDVIRLNNLLFYSNSTLMRPESYGDLQQLLKIMQDNPDLKIKIEGHICCNKEQGMVKGTEQYNLSVNRAKAVYFFLADNGITTDRLSYEGYGRTRPLYPNEENVREEIANRRVEIRILGK